jgi:hypothetical protein
MLNTLTAIQNAKSMKTFNRDNSKVKMAQTSRNNLLVRNSLNEYSDVKNINIIEPTEVSPRLT